MSGAGLLLGVVLTACAPAPEGIARSRPAATTVKLDFEHRPLPEIPLPNDIATRPDPDSATGRRINASQIAPTGMEERVRRRVDGLDGWGVFQPISIPFTGPLDVQSILDAHRDPNYGFEDDVVYLVNIMPDSPGFGTVQHLDMGNGNYPVVIERRSQYWDNDPREETLSMLFEDTDEDKNGNGVLDPGEDTDGDGWLDFPNYYPGADPDPDDLAARADALMTFYESQTNTLIVRPLVPLDERTTYAVVVTRRLLDRAGDPVGSPYPWVHHLKQTAALKPLAGVLANARTPDGRPVELGIGLDDVAFAFTFTTQTVEAGWKAVRDGLYGYGVQAHIGQRFPAEIERLYELRSWDMFPDMEVPHIIYGEQWSEILTALGLVLLDFDDDSEHLRVLMEGIRYIDYIVVGSYCSPQLFTRGEGSEHFTGSGCSVGYDPDALREDESFIPARDWISLDDQAWPEDLYREPVKTRPERVYFTLVVPRKEVSLRGQGQHSQVIIAGHGYTSNRFEGLQWAGYWARHGLATLAIDGVSHGIGITSDEMDLARDVLDIRGAGPFLDNLLRDRAWDQDRDGVKDSAADFWTGYLFHTRDVVRQTALDYMQLIRILRTFDGTRRWSIEVEGEGRTVFEGLAGDFDGDGQVDVGKNSEITMAGGSLGGMMSMVMGSVEPELTAIAPMAGGGGVTDLGVRTTQGGALEGFMLRAMGPFFTGDLDAGTGVMAVSTIIPDLNDDAKVHIADVTGVLPGDTMIVENLDGGEEARGLVMPDGGVRAAVAADEGDPIAIRFYRGAELVAEVTQFGVSGEFQYHVFQPGDALFSLAEGLALPRAHPDLRRFVGIGQLVLDPADPAVLARHALRDPMTYPGTGHTTGTHVLQITTQGDTSVPVAGGMSFGRAAGLIDYLSDRADLGTTENQHLIDTYVAEGVHLLNRHLDGSGRGVHMDVEHLSEGTHPWDPPTYPTSPTPLRIGVNQTDPLGGISASLFPLTNPTGAHGFDLPGEMVDKARRKCRNECQPDPDACGCDELWAYDVGRYLLDLAGSYLSSGGTRLELDLCHSDQTCPAANPPPEPRDPSELTR